MQHYLKMTLDQLLNKLAELDVTIEYLNKVKDEDILYWDKLQDDKMEREYIRSLIENNHGFNPDNLCVSSN
jgi:hypothetical protein